MLQQSPAIAVSRGGGGTTKGNHSVYKAWSLQRLHLVPLVPSPWCKPGNAGSAVSVSFSNSSDSTDELIPKQEGQEDKKQDYLPF